MSKTQPTEKTRPKLVACIPCFNTGPFIADVVCRAKKYVDEVIVIDDGSHDGTAEAARAAGALVLSHDTNRGYGETINSCFEAAKTSDAEVLIILDGDGQHNPDEIPLLLSPTLRQEADLVVGSRFLPDSKLRTDDSRPSVMPGYRRFGIGVITSLWNFGSKVKVSDTQSGFRAYRMEAFHGCSLRETGMSVSIETLEKARRDRAAIREVPISCEYIPSSLSFEAIKHGLRVALSVVRIRLKSRLRRPPGDGDVGNQGP